MSAENVTTPGRQIIALINLDDHLTLSINQCNFQDRQLMHFKNGMQLFSAWESNKLNIVAIISQDEVLASSGITLFETLKKNGLANVPFFLIVNHFNSNLRSLALNAGVADVFRLPVKEPNLETRVNFLIEHWHSLKNNVAQKTAVSYKIPTDKRIFDILFSGLALLFLSPLFLLIYLAIKLESKGPAFYYSLRVGTGYQAFKFYKFRSMYVNADQRLKDLKHLNQYDTDAAKDKEPAKQAVQNTVLLCAECQSSGKCQFPIYADKVQWCEKEYMDNKKSSAGSAFFKIKNDPRITRVGNFIRNTSIDELPQLWNVFIGDMSIVGNRPLPLYEAEKLTTDKYALRFHAPAGITGLWQVEKRGKGDMSEEERLMLDNVYAQNHSLANDIKLILKTIPALLQKENV
ncbi:sugar transferase [Mucilaginibacter sp. Bleaf8]|uniref:sugar transferase n=1 Tax=Mucilaginibacter sp. Bleaf8 TaxID=2834430 RepID=UPI001BCDB1D5|nr:sugar transferase [Mucilaginibacter sp. Bleaf8]MBS7564132.1 sugar transferase [Mucilaginibacter sp. Bleaf8]